MEALVGNTIARILADKGYPHNAPPDYKFRVFLSGQKRGDANNAVLAAAGYNFRRLIHWLRLLLRQILSALLAEPVINPA
jgi:IS5 family transposase